MKIDDEEKTFREIAKSIPDTIDMVLDYADKGLDCLENIISNGICVIDKENFEQTLKTHIKLTNASIILISLADEIGDLEELNLLKLMTVTSTIKGIEKIFEEVTRLVDLYNSKVIAKEFNVDALLITERLKNFMDYDTINFDDLITASNPRLAYMVLKVEDRFDRETNDIYGDFNVLRINSFTSKVEAFQYALANGISRDMIICKY